MEGGECLEQVERDVHRLPVAKIPLSSRELLQRLAVNELGDEIPLARARLAGPEDLHHVAVPDLPQRADLAAHRLMPGGGGEQLECSLLALDLVTDLVDLRESALPEQSQDLETVVDDVTRNVVGGDRPGRRGGLRPRGGPRRRGVIFRERLAAGTLRRGGPYRRASRSAERAGAAPCLRRLCRRASGIALHVLYAADGVREARVQHVGCPRQAGSGTARRRPWSRTGA